MSINTNQGAVLWSYLLMHMVTDTSLNIAIISCLPLILHFRHILHVSFDP